MNQLATRNENLPTTEPETNPFTEHAQQANISSIVGKLLKFSKGDYTVDDKDVPHGTRFIVNMDSMIHGWVKWQEQKPVEQLMGLMVDRFKVPARKMLGDDDPSQWELLGGKPIDPWAETYQVVMMGVDDNQLYTFSSTSWGGKKAFVKLCQEYGHEMRKRENEWPVIEIGMNVRDSDDYGRIKEPLLTISSWVPKSAFDGDEPELPIEDTAERALPKTKF